MADKVLALESAILERADRLAQEYLDRAKRSRDNILREAHERLHLREEREVLIAKALSERTFRRKVQASELKFHKEIDHLRWSLVQSVHGQILEHLEQFYGDRDNYLRFFQKLLQQSIRAFQEPSLAVMVNSKDLSELDGRWEEFIAPMDKQKQIMLDHTPIETLGGFILRDKENQVRLDNTFEGRIQRFDRELNRLIIEQLMPASPENGSLITGK